MHTFATTEEFTFTNGNYERKADKGNAKLYPSFSLDIGYYLKMADNNSPKILSDINLGQNILILQILFL